MRGYGTLLFSSIDSRLHVNGGRGAGCHVLCLMLRVALSYGETMGCVEGLQLHLTALLLRTQGIQAF